MSVQKVLVPPLRAVPPAAAWAADAIEWLFGTGSGQPGALSRWLATAREHRLAERALRREADDRVALVALAQRYASTQPEFAKDLFAAAATDRRT